jgi:hypothetical protein
MLDKKGQSFNERPIPNVDITISRVCGLGTTTRHSTQTSRKKVEPTTSVNNKDLGLSCNTLNFTINNQHYGNKEKEVFTWII